MGIEPFLVASSVEAVLAQRLVRTICPKCKEEQKVDPARIALAIAVTTSQLGQAQTLIFDEVDSGVGGAVAETVGRLMSQLYAEIAELCMFV